MVGWAGNWGERKTTAEGEGAGRNDLLLGLRGCRDLTAIPLGRHNTREPATMGRIPIPVTSQSQLPEYVHYVTATHIDVTITTLTSPPPPISPETSRGLDRRGRGTKLSLLAPQHGSGQTGRWREACRGVVCVKSLVCTERALLQVGHVLLA